MSTYAYTVYLLGRIPGLLTVGSDLCTHTLVLICVRFSIYMLLYFYVKRHLLANSVTNKGIRSVGILYCYLLLYGRDKNVYRDMRTQIYLPLITGVLPRLLYLGVSMLN
jgi:hypothetical protein